MMNSSVDRYGRLFACTGKQYLLASVLFFPPDLSGLDEFRLLHLVTNRILCIQLLQF